MPTASREEVIDFLRIRGADRLLLHHRTLLAHLTGTEELLRQWGAADELAVAGLVHAAYGTDGLVSPLVPVDERQTLRELVGVAAERVVYLYGCCDRRFVYPQLTNDDAVRWRDRFTGQEWHVGDGELRAFVELTWANALEAATAETRANWDSVRLLFAATSHLVSSAAHVTAAATFD